MISASIDWQHITRTICRSGQVCSGNFLKGFVYEREVIDPPSFDHACSDVLIITVLRSQCGDIFYTLAFLRRRFVSIIADS